MSQIHEPVRILSEFQKEYDARVYALLKSLFLTTSPESVNGPRADDFLRCQPSFNNTMLYNIVKSKDGCSLFIEKRLKWRTGGPQVHPRMAVTGFLWRPCVILISEATLKPKFERLSFTPDVVRCDPSCNVVNSSFPVYSPTPPSAKTRPKRKTMQSILPKLEEIIASRTGIKTLPAANMTPIQPVPANTRPLRLFFSFDNFVTTFLGSDALKSPGIDYSTYYTLGIPQTHRKLENTSSTLPSSLLSSESNYIRYNPFSAYDMTEEEYTSVLRRYFSRVYTPSPSAAFIFERIDHCFIELEPAIVIKGFRLFMAEETGDTNPIEIILQNIRSTFESK